MNDVAVEARHPDIAVSQQATVRYGVRRRSARHVAGAHVPERHEAIILGTVTVVVGAIVDARL